MPNTPNSISSPIANIRYLDWPAPARVKACYSLRNDGVSESPYASFNMGDHVGDQLDHVVANRQQLAHLIGQEKIAWLKQVHGVHVIDATEAITANTPIAADACFSHQAQQVCCVMTADCLPVFLTNRSGSQVAVAHAGWRGLLDGVIQQTLSSFDRSEPLMAYLGPAISQKAFEVGDEVKQAFLAVNPAFDECFIPSNHSPQEFQSSQPNKWMADLYGLARMILRDVGVTDVYGGGCCTYTEEEMFFSFRRDGITGRMANLIWIE